MLPLRVVIRGLRQNFHILSAGIIFVYILFFSLISCFRYNSFDFKDFDFAIYGQVMWNLLHGSMESSILGIPFLGNHMDLILFVVLPFYAVFKHPITLLFLQNILIGLGAVPVYLLAKRILDKDFAFIFSLLYLFYPALNFVNYFEFHPLSFVIVFLLCMIYYFEKENFRLFTVFMVLSLLCKENVALGVIFYGIYAWIFRRRAYKWVVVPILTGALYFILTLKLMGFLNKGVINFNYLYSNLGNNLTEIFVNILKRPDIVFQSLFSSLNLDFLMKLLLPLSLLSVFSNSIFIALPFFLQQMLSIRVMDHTINYHYTATLIPFLFISAIYGARFILDRKYLKKNALICILLAGILLSNVCFGMVIKMPFKQDIDYKKEDFVKKIPLPAPVVATFEYLPKLSQRAGIYSFHHVYMNRYTLSDKEYILPENIEYALIDFNDSLTFSAFYRPEHCINLQKFFTKDNWGVIDGADDILLLKKNNNGADTGFCVFLGKAPPLEPPLIAIEDNIGIKKYEIKHDVYKPGGVVGLTLFWESLCKTNKDYWAVFKIVDEKNNVLHFVFHPVCYRIYPAYLWQKGDLYKEEVKILIPYKIKEKHFYIKMAVFDRMGVDNQHGRIEKIAMTSHDNQIFDKEGWIVLGEGDLVNK